MVGNEKSRRESGKRQEPIRVPEANARGARPDVTLISLYVLDGSQTEIILPRILLLFRIRFFNGRLVRTGGIRIQVLRLWARAL